MKIGIALGGGGAKGFAHIGVLQELAQAGIDCEVVAGTSIGSLVGAVYAAGKLDQLARESELIKITDIPILLSPSFSLRGFFSGKNALEMLEVYLDVENIEDLSKPFAATSVDLNSSQTVVFTKGNLRQAIRASIAIPVLFTPVVKDDKLLIDGGILEPVPVRIARELGADYVIAVDLFGNLASAPVADSNPLTKGLPPAVTSALTYLASLSSKIPFLEKGGTSDKQHARNLIDMLEGTLAISQRQLTEARLREHQPDLLIQPPLSNIGLLDFHKGTTTIEIGRAAAKEVIKAIPRF